MSKILLIEDSSRTIALFEKCLSSEGYDILTAQNGQDGIQSVHRHQPDLIICDIAMPQCNGFEVLSSLRQDPMTAMIPFIFLSARSARADVRYGMDLGADDYLTKPCSIDELLRAVSSRLNRQKTFQQWCITVCQNDPSGGLNTFEDQDSITPDSIFPSIPKLRKIFDFIEEKFRQPITLADIARATNYSPAYMTHLVKLQTKRSVHCWIIERRMLEARKLLLEDHLTVKEIALQIGYSDPSYFMRQFKQHHKISAKAWQKKHLQD